MTPPDTHAGRARWVRAVDPGAVRHRCGISASTIGRALGVHPSQVLQWEAGSHYPKGRRGAAYARIIAGLIRHLDVEVPDG